jgi:glycerol kinase
MEKDTGVKLKMLKVDGGASRDSFLMQFQADILNADVVKPHTHETTALGVAMLAGLTVGVWQDENEVRSLQATDRTYLSTMSEAERKEKLSKWHKAVERSLGWDLP